MTRLARLFLLAISEAIECRHTVGLSPEADHAWLSKRCILDLEQRLAVEDDFEACARKLHAERVPLIGGHSRLDAVATLASYDVERTTRAVQGLVEHDVILK